MNIEARKLTIIDQFLRLQNVEIITQIENILAKVKNTNINSDFNPMSREELNKRIDLSMNDSINGRLISNEDLIKEIKQWD